eukprot:NODE_669_length_5359_cov_0.427376.p4 type:complete len:120 gc:universal NODE_669_length_5359_cov_0.427376:1061-1420(+)
MSFNRDVNNTKFNSSNIRLLVNKNIFLNLNSTVIYIEGNWTSYEIFYSNPINLNFPNCSIDIGNMGNNSFLKIRSPNFINDTSILAPCGSNCWTYNVPLQNDSTCYSIFVLIILLINIS